KGRLMETLIAIELQRIKSFDKQLEVYYWKDHRQREVDFVLKKGKKVKQLIQASFASSKNEINKRELIALSKASQELKCNDLTIITWDYEGMESLEKNKVKLIPLWKWLLSH
ncbi:ATP-binding protein, partial [archaeon]|nr:ATP-binding protein [archaeon]